MGHDVAYARAETLYHAGQWQEAMTIYREIVAAAPADARAWALMGLCAMQLGLLDAAVAALSSAADLEPKATNVHFRLGIAQFQSGRMPEAERAFRRVLALDPAHADAKQNLAATLVDQGRHAEARPLFEDLVAKDPNFELAWAGLANVYLALGDVEGMRTSLERAVAINPQNAATRHLLQAARGENPPRPDPAYVAQFFDNYATRFESHLIERLSYAAPETLMAMLQQVYPVADRFVQVLDLGCGTGLMAAAFRKKYSCSSLIGVDLSPQMIKLAHRRGVYTEVVKSDVVDFLRQAPQTYDLISAVDVFIYIGDVSGLFAAASSHLSACGVLAFTVELTTAQDYLLQANGRYAHRREALARLAGGHGFKVKAERIAPLRRDGKRVENGLYMLLERAA